ncbi:hypothetical protein [Mycobacterium sp. 1465703.0]|uniref:hypothetical protein n=1 Tax=Mycobacterium sp. 1465703.0 TaxID=1834078 RepID=UPI0007FE0680|nr:hypothetical protein [Mycobacterium sp. 1465703.0]OBJ09670.1 hypothetical protein A5625_12655 [Mycobacterium sp. 1465703.0]
METTVDRPPPNSSISVAPFIGPYDGGEERLVRVAGFGATDYLTSSEARALARALDVVCREVK